MSMPLSQFAVNGFSHLVFPQCELLSVIHRHTRLLYLSPLFHLLLLLSFKKTFLGKNQLLIFSVAKTDFSTKHFNSKLKLKCVKREHMLKSVRCCFVVDKLCPTLLWPCGLQPARLLCPWDSPGKNTRVGCHFLLQGIFLTQGLNPCLLLGRQILYHWAT